ncbi:zinc-dependent peptidase [Niveibacterium terrae]|uniref:M90 family metallopeptidase n=1 Tax=Niveibacterium terrae TaxID=3373598 RepID=UPI003A8DA3A4
MRCFSRLFKRRTAPPVPAEQWETVEAPLADLLAHLSPAERASLRTQALDFLARKQICGAAGLQITDEIRLTIALQACLPILKLDLAAYDGWVEIIVYPGDFVIPRRQVSEDGVLHEYDEIALGEAWKSGPVVLSWFGETANPPGTNVVIHEFAHKLDMINGEADGLPPLHAGMSIRDWERAFSLAYRSFCRCVDAGENLGIDPYAAEHPAEFFAVLSEVFFASPATLARLYPAVYRQLALFYRQDPLAARPAPPASPFRF